MVGEISQDAWVRACLAGIEQDPLSFHPFSGNFSRRARADTQAATAFLAQERLIDYYQLALQAPQGIVAGILAVRADILLARRFSGVASNIAACMDDLFGLNDDQLSYTQAQAVYRQLWQYNTSQHNTLIQPLNQTQCAEISHLLAQAEKLASYLSGFKWSSVDLTLSAPQVSDEQADDQAGDSVENAEQVQQDNAAACQVEDSENLADIEDADAESKQGEQPYPPYLDALSVPSRQYQIFTEQYDRVVPATSLAPLLGYGVLKSQILAQLPEYNGLSRRLANKLRRQLMSWQQHGWQEDLEEGYLHAAKLAALIASPTSVRPFRQEIRSPFPATAVTLLIDCSGSMQGKPLLMMAAWVDALVEALELCQIKTEVLGFTTGQWCEGPVQQEWQQQGGNKYSGRLNELLHVEFKGFDHVWRRARNGLAAVLQRQWQKENIDGEALDWAYRRLKARVAQKKLLFVLSDAKPYDQLTLDNNGRHYLEQDLRRRVNKIQQDPQVELMGIGLGHRVCRVYPTSVQVKQIGELPQAMLETLLKKLQAIR